MLGIHAASGTIYIQFIRIVIFMSRPTERGREVGVFPWGPEHLCGCDICLYCITTVHPRLSEPRLSESSIIRMHSMTTPM